MSYVVKFNIAFAQQLWHWKNILHFQCDYKSLSKVHGPAPTAACRPAAQLAAVLLCKSHQVILYYISNITNVSDYRLFRDLSGLCPSLHSLILLAFSAEQFSNLDGDCLFSSSFCWCMVCPCFTLVVNLLSIWKLFYFLGFLFFWSQQGKNKHKTLWLQRHLDFILKNWF